MDETDIRICRALAKNSRQPYRAVARSLEMSIQAVHRRVQLLEASGVIRRYTACLTDQFLNATKARFAGASTLRDHEELVRALGRDDRTLYLFFCSMSEVAITALLRNVSELDDYLGFLEREARISGPMVAFTGVPQFGPKGARPRMAGPPELKQIDWNIIHSLGENPLILVTDLAKSLGASAATVKRRLDRLMGECVLEFSIDYYPMASPSSLVFLVVQLKPDVDRKTYMDRFVEANDRHILLDQPLIDKPGTFMALLWTPTQQDVNAIVADMSADPCVRSSYTKVVQDIHVFRTWRERLVEERALAASS